MKQDLLDQIMLRLSTEISDHNEIYNEDDDTWYTKDEKCKCEKCIAYVVLFNMRQDIVEGK